MEDGTGIAAAVPAYDRAAALISLGAIEHNYGQIVKRVGANSTVIAVVKADAYGHGSVEVSRALIRSGVRMLAVATAGEALELRKHGIPVPILILGAFFENHAQNIVEYDLIQTIFSVEAAELLSETAVRLKKTVLVHIKADTGMGRVGFFPDRDAVSALRKIQGLPNIRMDAIYTHLPSADETDKSFTRHQIKTLRDFQFELLKEGVFIPHMHVANSACVLDMEEGFLDFVRPGLILYGLYPSDEVFRENIPLKPAMTLKSRLVQIKELEPGMTVSYGRTFRADGRCRIGTVPVGYADGYGRRMSSAGRVILRGEYAPVAGRICMDQFMIDITRIPEAAVGDEVVLMGSADGLCVSAEEIAAHLGTINYEVVSRIGARIPRIYTE